MSRVLVYLVHADPVVRRAYQAALDRAFEATGCTAELVIPPVAGGYSSAYVTRASQLRSAGGGSSVLSGLLRAHPPSRDTDALVIATFSAGYALARAILMDAPDAARVHGYAAIDSVHAGLDHGRASGLAWLIAYAQRAEQDQVSLWLGHTDVQTPQAGPSAFASTTQVARAIIDEVGPGGAGGWHCEAFDEERDQRREHMRALTGWGPEWVAGCALEVAERRGLVLRMDGEIVRHVETPIDQEPLGLRALRLAVAELEAGVCEVPTGSNTGPRIREYLARCERDGRPVGLTAGDWCAAAASWCAYQAQRGAEVVPHRWRISVRELWADAVASGAAVRAAPGVLPEPGDLAILARVPGEDPTRGGRGHVGRVELVDGEFYATIDGNSGVSWKRNYRRLDDPALRGWIRYPRALSCTPETLRDAAVLRACAVDGDGA